MIRKRLKKNDSLKAQEKSMSGDNTVTALLNASPESAFLLDASGVVLDCSQVAAQRLGIEPEELKGKCIYDLIPAETAASRRKYVEEVLRTGIPVTFEDVRGEYCFQHHIHPDKDSRGRITGLAVYGHEVSEFRNIEKDLKKQMEILSAIKQAQSIFISGHDTRKVYEEMLHILVSATDSAFGFLNEVQRETDGTPFRICTALSDISWDEGSRELYRMLTQRELKFFDMNNTAGAPVIQGQTIIANDTPHHPRYKGLPDGHPPVDSFMGIPLYYGEELVGVAGVANRPGGYGEEIIEFIEPLTQACAAMLWAGKLVQRDRENLAALKSSEEKYRLLVENQTNLIVKTDRDDRLLFVSPSFCRLFSKTEEELLGEKFMPLIAPEDEESKAEVMKTLSASPYTAALEKKTVTGKDSAWLAWAFTAVPDSRGNLLEIIGVGRNITKRKEAEEEREIMQAQLVQAQKMESVGRLAGGVAHDFNNMLGVILGYSEIALQKLNKTHPLYSSLTEIYKAADRSASLTRQLLAFARKQTITPRVLDMNTTLEGMLKMLRRLVGENIDLEFLPGKELWPIRMDPSQIDQILANLCINARDAIQGVGKVVLKTGRTVADPAGALHMPGAFRGEYVLLTFSDNGSGMDEETRSHLFEPFYTTKTMDKGTGLGLATIYGIVKQNNGFITVTSETGRGTTFFIYFPRDEGKTEPQPAEGTAAPAARGTGTILLVEDEPVILEMTAEMLSQLGYTVLCAPGPEEALTLAGESAGEIRLLITDVIMPRMNGRDLAAKLQSLYPGIRLLFMSGYTADVIAPHGVLDPEVSFIQKPFTLTGLAGKIREILDSTQENSE